MTDYLGHGKRSIALNLKSKEGIEIFKRLSNQSDVLIDPFRKGLKIVIHTHTHIHIIFLSIINFSHFNYTYIIIGVMEQLKLGPEELMATNKKLIYARLTGYGQYGPYAKMAGHDINYLGLSGNNIHILNDIISVV